MKEKIYSTTLEKISSLSKIELQIIAEQYDEILIEVHYGEQTFNVVLNDITDIESIENGLSLIENFIEVANAVFDEEDIIMHFIEEEFGEITEHITLDDIETWTDFLENRTINEYRSIKEYAKVYLSFWYNIPDFLEFYIDYERLGNDMLMNEYNYIEKHGCLYIIS